ncbi:MAG: phosphopyruvate hydratase [Planctomycetes bacterium]|nr:phosphopyruvate hydratase [Planctomycetota bacterium]
MLKIKSIMAREIFDSRGNPTLEVDVTSVNEIQTRAAVPSGASTGSFEAIELRDGNKKRFKGKGVLKAIKNVKKCSRLLKGKKFASINEIDKILLKRDQTAQKSKIGANTTLGISLACIKALAAESEKEFFEFLGKSKSLPIPFLNIINGGVHADNELDFQEFMIVPHGFKRFSHAIRAASEIFQTLKSILKEKRHNTNVGDEGGFAPQIKYPQTAIELILLAIRKAGYKPKKEVSIALDCAASEFFHNERYVVNKKRFKARDLVKLYERLVAAYPIVSIEDPFAEDDWDGWIELTKAIGDRVLLVGDDLYVTNLDRLAKGVAFSASNAVLIKPNQIGTVSETIDCITFAEQSNLFRIISHRSGETEDTSIAHMAVGLGVPGIKTGSVCRSERTAKYNELLRIEELLGNKAGYAKLPGFVKHQ